MLVLMLGVSELISLNLGVYTLCLSLHILKLASVLPCPSFKVTGGRGTQNLCVCLCLKGTKSKEHEAFQLLLFLFVQNVVSRWRYALVTCQSVEIHQFYDPYELVLTKKENDLLWYYKKVLDDFFLGSVCYTQPLYFSISYQFCLYSCVKSMDCVKDMRLIIHWQWIILVVTNLSVDGLWKQMPAFWWISFNIYCFLSALDLTLLFVLRSVCVSYNDCWMAFITTLEKKTMTNS